MVIIADGLTLSEMTSITAQRQPIGRFAPSPTGRLHLGSLVTAVASFCAMRAMGGRWLVRLEDTDWQRCQPAYSDSILAELDRLGLYWDGEVRHQSQHLASYQAVLAQSLSHVTYACQCTRKQLSHSPNVPYPQLCWGKSLDKNTHAVRIVMPNYQMGFFDQLQGNQWQNPQQSVGDMVVRRQNGMINYLLAVVIDDIAQGITHIIRGMDILPLTFPQLALSDYLSQGKLPNRIQQFYHLPLLVDRHGNKLSKQTLAEPTHPYPASALIKLVLQLLHQPNVSLDTPERMLAQAIAQWDFSPLMGQTLITLDKNLADMVSNV